MFTNLAIERGPHFAENLGPSFFAEFLDATFQERAALLLATLAVQDHERQTWQRGGNDGNDGNEDRRDNPNKKMAE